MTVQHLEILYPDRVAWASHCERFRQAKTLPELVWTALQIGMLFTRIAVEQELNRRAMAATNWLTRSGCQQQVRSKGLRPRQMQTLIGCIK